MKKIAIATVGSAVTLASASILTVATIGASVLVSRPHTPSPRQSMGQSSAHVATATHSTSTTPTATEPTTKPIRVGLEPARFAQFAKPTLREFAETGLVNRVVRGQIASVDYSVSDDASHLVFTIYAIRPLNKVGKPQGDTITVTETGGVVPLREVSSDFTDEGHTLTPKQLDQPVDFSDGTAHPVVGDTTVVFLKHTTGHEYLGLARMTLDPSTDEYEWAGEAPNEEWSSTELTNAQVESDYGSLVQEK